MNKVLLCYHVLASNHLIFQLFYRSTASYWIRYKVSCNSKHRLITNIWRRNAIIVYSNLTLIESEAMHLFASLFSEAWRCFSWCFSVRKSVELKKLFRLHFVYQISSLSLLCRQFWRTDARIAYKLTAKKLRRACRRYVWVWRNTILLSSSVIHSTFVIGDTRRWSWLI